MDLLPCCPLLVCITWPSFSHVNAATDVSIPLALHRNCTSSPAVTTAPGTTSRFTCKGFPPWKPSRAVVSCCETVDLGSIVCFRTKKWSFLKWWREFQVKISQSNNGSWHSFEHPNEQHFWVPGQFSSSRHLTKQAVMIEVAVFGGHRPSFSASVVLIASWKTSSENISLPWIMNFQWNFRKFQKHRWSQKISLQIYIININIWKMVENDYI